MNQLFYKHHYWASTYQSIYLSYHFYLLSNLLNLLLAANSNQFGTGNVLYCLRYAMPALRLDPSLLTVWSFYSAYLSNTYLVAAMSYLLDSHVVLDLLADQLISSSGIIFQGNSTKHCPSWDLLCQDSKANLFECNKEISSSLTWC